MSLKLFKILRLLLVTALIVSCIAGCESDSGNGVEPDVSDRNFVARNAITDSLAAEKELDFQAREMMRQVETGQYGLEQGLDDLVDQTRSLLSMIDDVAGPEEPPDEYLSEALGLTERYLRDRVHQLEAALSAGSPEELERLYQSKVADLDAQRARIRELLILYSPDLEQMVPR